ncbi:MAG: LuxR family transcriptional regulator [Gammaproteobacteria bacterium]|nr:LuxR family transcriptional regulator [Gammaproteobacteria bacterium]
MQDRADATQFVKELLEVVFPKGQVERLGEFYEKEVVGHYGDNELFNFDDIKQRVAAIKKDAKNIQFVVENVVVIDNLILFICRQHWTNKKDSKFFEQMVYGVYRVKNKKIVELWILLNTPTLDYKEINTNFSDFMSPFEINQKAKQDFVKQLATFIKNNKHKLSAREQECLYYYFNGFSSKETAQEMKISPRTVEVYLAEIKQRYECSTKRQLRQHFFPT